MTHSGSLLGRRGRSLLVCAAAVAGLLAIAPAANAATISVPCGNTAALVSAINTANGTAVADTIDVTGAPCGTGTSAGFVLTTAAAPSGGNDTGLPIVTKPLTIQGHGAVIQRSSAAPNFRILFANAAALDLHDLTILGGKLTGTNFVGAGVAGVNAALTMDNVLLYSNQSSAGVGGGIYAQGGSLSVDHSTFEFNVGTVGAGLYAVLSPTTIQRSLLFENVATSAAHNGSTGGAAIVGTTSKFENDTFALNLADNAIGGIGVLNSGASQGTATVESTTIADSGNSPAAGAPPGGAIFTCASACGGTAAAPVVHLHNSIITDTDSTAAAVLKPCDVDFGGSIVNDGGNLEWPGTTCPGAAHADPKLAAIALNGGPTFNYRLLPSSPAIDLGTSPCPATDQRNKARPGGDACDAGAYETHPPQTTAAANSPTSSPQVTFSSDQAGSSFECKVDGGSFSACTSPFSPALAEGSHDVYVRASHTEATSGTNLSDNTYTDPSPAHVTIVVDTTAPDTTITGGPSGDITTGSTSFTFVSSEAGSTFECSLDSAAFTPCSSGDSVSGYGFGNHTFQVRAIDQAGNVDASPDSRSFTYIDANDTTGPVVQITSAPPAVTNDTTATVAFTVDDPTATVTCKVDSGPAGPCTSPFTTAPLSDGSHTITVTATDPSHNVGQAVATFIVDTSPPDTSIDDGPTGTIYNATTATFSFSSSEPASTFECSLDSSTFQSCTSPDVVPITAGSHTFQVRAIDGAGNVDPSPASQSFTNVIDTTAPVVDITQGPLSPTNNPKAKVVFTVDDATATVTCQVDSGPQVPCSSPFTSNALSDGQHTITVRGTDPAGNVGSDSVTFEVDTTPPNTIFTSTPGAQVYQNPAKPYVTYKFDSSESPATFECRFDGSPWAACTSPTQVSTAPPLRNGSHTFEVRARDVAGNVDPTPASHTFNFTRCAVGPIFLPGGGVYCVS